MAREHQDVVIAAGLHPLHTAAKEPQVQDIVEVADRYAAVAIGESGLDYHYRDTVPPEVQYARFERHLLAARELALPIVVHTREAQDDTLALLRQHTDPGIGGVLHCFTEDLDMAREAVRLGMYISFSGIVTFANAKALREVARQIPLDRILIETDSPYLAPVPYRGKPNEPAWVVKVAECLADLRGISVDEVAMQTTANFYHLFRQATPEAPEAVQQALRQNGMLI